MGAWSSESFGNDTACDWVYEFLEAPGLASVEAKLNEVLVEDDYLESDVASECVAACEVIARLKGNWGTRDSYSEKIDQWVESSTETPSPELIEKAQAALKRILGEDSELLELWDDDGHNHVWHGKMDDLINRVRS